MRLDPKQRGRYIFASLLVEKKETKKHFLLHDLKSFSPSLVSPRWIGRFFFSLPLFSSSSSSLSLAHSPHPQRRPGLRFAASSPSVFQPPPSLEPLCLFICLALYLPFAYLSISRGLSVYLFVRLPCRGSRGGGVN